jgi:cytoskeletal protein CcmA (bactofilin family)
MGIFSKESGTTSKHSATTVIASECRITGTIQLSCDIQIDGKVEGNISSEKTVVISSSGHVKGEIFAEKIIINGQVEGSCYANLIQILEKGKVKGSSYSDNLSINQGGLFHGEMYPMEKNEIVEINRKELQNIEVESVKKITNK